MSKLSRIAALRRVEWLTFVLLVFVFIVVLLPRIRRAAAVDHAEGDAPSAASRAGRETPGR